MIWSPSPEAVDFLAEELYKMCVEDEGNGEWAETSQQTKRYWRMRADLILRTMKGSAAELKLDLA